MAKMASLHAEGYNDNDLLKGKMRLQDYTISDKKYWQAGRDYERERIVKLIRDRVSSAKEYSETGQITAMQKVVSYEDLEAISEAIVYGIEKEVNEL